MKMRLNLAVAAASLCLAATHMRADGGGLDPAELLKPLSDSWPTYSGDYSGRRYSALTQINQSNVKNLTLAWSARILPGLPAAPSGRAGGGFGAGAPAALTIIGGEGTGELNDSGGRT